MVEAETQAGFISTHRVMPDGNRHSQNLGIVVAEPGYRFMELALALTMIEADPALNIRHLPKMSKTAPGKALITLPLGVFAYQIYLLVRLLPSSDHLPAHAEKQSTNLAAA